MPRLLLTGGRIQKVQLMAYPDPPEARLVRRSACPPKCIGDGWIGEGGKADNVSATTRLWCKDSPYPA
ncbi:MAG: hypothetical protein WCG75_03555 [Armatimonadota bacterium]